MFAETRRSALYYGVNKVMSLISTSIYYTVNIVDWIAHDNLGSFNCWCRYILDSQRIHLPITKKVCEREAYKVAHR